MCGEGAKLGQAQPKLELVSIFCNQILLILGFNQPFTDFHIYITDHDLVSFTVMFLDERAPPNFVH